MMQALINGMLYPVTERNEIVYNGRCIPFIQDIYGNFWVIVDAHLYELRTFIQDGMVCYLRGAEPEFISKAPVSKLGEGIQFELSELDQYWNLDRTEFYILVSYRVKADEDVDV